MAKPATSVSWFAAAAVLALSAGSASAAAPPDLRGTWQPQRYIPALKTVDGAIPPLRPEAKALYEQRIADRKAGKSDDPLQACLPAGTPRILYQARPFMIVQTPNKVTFVHEYEHMLRHVYLNAPPAPADADPNWNGYSVGHWAGDALEIDTTGFNGKTWLDEAGLPYAAGAKVTERLKRIDAATLEDQITIDDPKSYTAPWTTRLTFKRAPDTPLGSHICMEKLIPEPADARPKPDA